MKTVMIIIILLVLGSGAVQRLNVYQTKSELAAHVDRQLDFADNASMNSVKQTLVQDAQKLGIELTPENIFIKYEDTEQRTIAQQLVGRRLGTQFVNKRITISVHYNAHIFGISFGQDITSARIRQVEAPRMPMRPEERQLLDPTGASGVAGVADIVQ